MSFHRVFWCIYCLVLSAHTPLIAQESTSLQLVLFTNNVGFVSDTREVHLSTKPQTFSFYNLPKSVQTEDAWVYMQGRMLQFSMVYPVYDAQRLLQQQIGQSIQLVSASGDVIEGEVVAFEGGQVFLKQADRLIQVSGLANYVIRYTSLPEQFGGKVHMQATMRGDKAGKQNVILQYINRGVSWQPEYKVFFDPHRKRAEVLFLAGVRNMTEISYEQAQVQLISGELNRVSPHHRSRAAEVAEVRASAKMASADGDLLPGEYNVYKSYSLPEKVNLASGSHQFITIHQARSVAATQHFAHKVFVHEGLNQKEMPSQVRLQMANERANELGLSFPPGRVQVFEAGKSVPQFIGEDMLNQTEENKPLKLHYGNSHEVLLTAVQSTRQVISDKVIEFTLELTIENKRKESIAYELELNKPYHWDLLSSSVKLADQDPNQIRFSSNLKIGQKQQMTLKYRQTLR